MRTIASNVVSVGTVEAEVVVDTALPLLGGELAAVGGEVHGGRAVVAAVSVGGVSGGCPRGRNRGVLIACVGTGSGSGIRSPGGCSSGCRSVGSIGTVLVVDLLAEVHECVEAGWFIDRDPEGVFDLVTEASLQGREL